MQAVAGDRVEILLGDNTWHLGTVKHALHRDSGMLWLINLDSGKPAFCGSEACIRYHKDPGV